MSKLRKLLIIQVFLFVTLIVADVVVTLEKSRHTSDYQKLKDNTLVSNLMD